MHENNGGRGARPGEHFQIDFDQFCAAITALDQTVTSVSMAPISGMRAEMAMTADEVTDSVIASVSEHFHAVAKAVADDSESIMSTLQALGAEVVRHDEAAAEQLRRAEEGLNYGV